MNRLALPYNFRAHAPFSPLQKQRVATLHADIGREVATALASLLGIMLKITLVRIEQYPFSLYKLHLTTPSGLAVCRFFPHVTHLLLEMDAGLAYAFINQLLGGNGESPQIAHNLSPVQIALMRKLNTVILKACIPSWTQLFGPLDCSVEGIFSNPEHLDFFDKTAPYVAFWFEVEFYHTRGHMSFLLPRHLFSVELLPETGEGKLSINPDDIILTVSASLGSITLPKSALERLQRGDVVALHNKANAPIDLLVNQQKTLKCYPGVEQQKKAVIIM